MLVQDLVRRDSGSFRGEFRALGSTWRRAANGRRFLKFGLRDVTGNLVAHGWEGDYQGPAEIQKNAKIRVEGELRWYQGHPIAEIEKVAIITEAEENPFVRPAEGVCLRFDALIRLYVLLEGITCCPLRQFAFSVFRDETIRQLFLALPASRSHHHSYAGGLLVHSVECAESVRSQNSFDETSLNLGIVAALFHDIGKIRTFDESGRFSQEGMWIGHDDLTLEILAPFLRQLDSVDHQIAVALRSILISFRNDRSRRRTNILIAEAVQAADRISAGRDAARLAFQDSPRWHRMAYFGGRRYLRLLHSHQCV